MIAKAIPISINRRKIHLKTMLLKPETSGMKPHFVFYFCATKSKEEVMTMSVDERQLQVGKSQ